MNLMYDSKVKKLIQDAEKQGFVLEHGRSKNTVHLIPPDKTKPIVVISGTPSDTNIYWEVRRMLKKSGYVE